MTTTRMNTRKRRMMILGCVLLCWAGSMARAATTYLFFDITVWYRSAQQKEYRILLPESTLYSGDYYRIQVTPKNDGYLYIFQQDSSGKIYRLFPMETFGTVRVNNFNPVRKGVKYMFPGKETAFVLDNQVGKETFYVLASSERDAALEAPFQEEDRRQELEMIDGLLVAAVTALGQPAFPPFSSQEGELAIEVLRERIQQMCQGCVFVLPFVHQ